MTPIPNRVHFVGIGGIGMSGLAKVLMEDGHRVSGSDRNPSDIANRLARAGATIAVGHAAENVNGAELVVITSALTADNPEVQAAQAAGVPIIKRAELLGRLMTERRGIAIAGTHGKTTTSAMVAHILLAAGADPTILVGGEIRGLETNARRGGGEWLVAEADEYDRSFLQLRPEIALITNVEADHLDIYRDLAEIQETFRQFAAQTTGTLILGARDAVLFQLQFEVAPPNGVQTYGLEAGDWYAEDIAIAGLGMSFTLFTPEDRQIAVRLNVPGFHNVENAVGAIAAAAAAGVSPSEAADALGAFQGAKRRLESVGEAGGVLVVDDYGHHPTEIRATLEALRFAYPDRRIVCLFQPHTYSRTKLLLAEFATCFGDADCVRIADIYAARETNSWGVTSEDLASAADHPDVRAVGSIEDAVNVLASETCEGDLVLTIGAGDVNRAGPLLLAHLA